MNALQIYIKDGDSNFNEELKKETIERDIRSITMIYRELRGNRPKSIETTDVFFITTNKALACACKNFNKQQAKEEGMSPCITDVFLGTILWFQNPVRYEELKTTQIIASCYAAIEPKSTLINAFKRKLEQLKDNNKISKEDYLLLREHKAIESMLSDKTMGNIDNINENTAYEMLEEIESEIKREVTEELKRANEENRELKEKNKALERKEQEREEELRKKAQRNTKNLTITIITLYIAVILIFAGVDMYFKIIDLSSTNDEWIRIVTHFIITTVPFIIGVLSWKKFKNKIEEKIYKRTCKKYHVNP